MIKIDLNSKDLQVYTNSLKELGRFDFPNAVRFTLNDLARDLKTNTMLESAMDSFTNRRANFFKANSTYVQAKGDDVGNMESRFNFQQHKLNNNSTNWSVQNLEQQEFGGVITNKSLVPTEESRIGGNRDRMVQRRNRLSDSVNGNIIDSAKIRQKLKGKVAGLSTGSDKGAFVLSIMLAGKNGFVLSNKENSRGERVVYRVDSSPIKKGHKYEYKITPIYSVKKGREFYVKKTGFVQKAATETHKKANQFYIKNFEDRVIRRFNKLTKK